MSKNPKPRKPIDGVWWAVADPTGKRPPCVIGKFKGDAEDMRDPDEIVVRVHVREVRD